MTQRRGAAAPRVVLLDSVTEGGSSERGMIVVTGSHGGLSAARYALRYRPLLVVFNDAGIGKDEAGVAGLGLLEQAGIAAASVDHDSARIGEAEDTWRSGVLSRVNAPARALGLAPGMRLRAAVAALFPDDDARPE